MFYTLAVLTPKWFGRSKRETYKVTKHKIDPEGGHLRLAIHLVDGTIVVIPGLDRKKLIIYPDYQDALKYRRENMLQQRQQAEKEPLASEDLVPEAIITQE